MQYAYKCVESWHGKMTFNSALMTFILLSYTGWPENAAGILYVRPIHQVHCQILSRLDNLICQVHCLSLFPPLSRAHARGWTDGGMHITYCRRYIVNGGITITINFSHVPKPPSSSWITVIQRQQKTQQYQHLCESAAATTAGTTLPVSMAQAVETVEPEFS